MGAEPITDMTEQALSCVWCDWDGRASAYWRGKSGTWICPRCGAVHEIGGEQ